MASVQSDVDWQSTKNTVLERSRHMFNNPEFSDISFTCEGSSKHFQCSRSMPDQKQFHAHKYVLATSSVVFKAMFYSDLAEKNSVVILTDTNAESLEEFLRFLYTDECKLTCRRQCCIGHVSCQEIHGSLAVGEVCGQLEKFHDSRECNKYFRSSNEI